MNDDIRRNAEIEAYYNAGKDDGEKLGFKQGIEQGIVSNRNEMIMNMYKDDLDIDIIGKYANLTVDEVLEIIKDNDN